jgi:hypothetical protein
MALIEGESRKMVPAAAALCAQGSGKLWITRPYSRILTLR